MDEPTKNAMEAEASRLIEQGMQLIRRGQDLWTKTKEVTITVVCRFFNDEMLLPFFMEHYSYADEIVIILDEGTVDNTRKLLARIPKVRIEEMEFPEGYDARITTAKRMEVCNSITTDWIICIDVDEFIFPAGFEDVRRVLSMSDGNVIYANMWQVYRNRTELDLDPSLKAIWLRRHGPPKRGNGANKRMDNKPLIFRSGLGIQFEVGFHSYKPNPNIRVSSTVFDGAHWKMADPDLAVLRRLRGRRENVSEVQVEAKWAKDDFDITEEEIRRQCGLHLDDPQLF